MKKKLLFIVSSLFVLVSCGENEIPRVIPDYNDIEFIDDKEEPDVKPVSYTLPNEGDEAIGMLDLDATVSYFDNENLHNLFGQWSGYGIHTPSIFKYGDYYYLYQSTPDTNIGIKAYRSKDLINYEFVSKSGFTAGYVFKDRMSYAAKNPQAIKYGDNFYLYYRGTNGYKILKASTPEGPFVYESDLNYSSKYDMNIFQAPNGKTYLAAGGEDSVSIFEMNDIFTVDGNSRAVVALTKNDGYIGYDTVATSPRLALVNNVLYLTYSSVKENLKSYRSYLVSAVNPDFTSSATLAASFLSYEQAPVLLNAEDDYGYVGLGDIQIVEGPDLVSYYALYTSLESTSVRRLNISPVTFSGSKMSIGYRKEIVFKTSELSHLENNNEEIVLSDSLGNKYTVQYHTNKSQTVYFGYRTRYNNYQINIDNENKKATFIVNENGLAKIISSVSIVGEMHDIKVIADDALTVFIDNCALTYNLTLKTPLNGKIGYKTVNEEKVDVKYIEKTLLINQKEMPKHGEEALLADTYLEKSSLIANGVKMVDSLHSEFYGQKYLDFTKAKEFVRFIVDAPKTARYGIELVFNGSFANHKSALGIRLGSNNEIMYKTTPIGEKDFVRTLTAEFNVNKGVNELLIENLSNDNLKLISARLVEVSEYKPSFANSLSDYATKGVTYVTEFLLDEYNQSHKTYEGARNFAYVGNKTITDFDLTIEISFLSGSNTSGFVVLPFRCESFASSSVDTDDSIVGYVLEVSQYQTRLIKRAYGKRLTIGIYDVMNAAENFKEYEIIVKGNNIKIYREEKKLFDFIDPFAFSNGHLGFGSNNTDALIRNLSIKGVD